MSLKRELMKGAENTARVGIRVAFWGAVCGAVVGGGLGFWLLGSTGLLYGLGIGALVGIVLFLAVRIWWWTET